MARTVLPFVGAAVGFWIGGPTGAQVGFALGGVVGNAVDPVKNIGPRIGETGAQTSAEGAPRGIVYGTAPVTGNVSFAGALVKGDFEEGGKGGPVNVTERCFRTYAIRICEGPIAGVLRIWENDKLVADFSPGSLIPAETAKWMFGCGIYLGGEDQLPDSFLLADPAGGENPAYRGSAYMVFVFRDLTDFRGAVPQYRFEVATSGTDVPLEKIDSYTQPFHGYYVNNFGFPLTPQHFDTTLPSGHGLDKVGDARVVLLTVTVATLEPGAGVTCSFSVYYNDDQTFSGAISGNGSFQIQLITLGKQIRVVSDITASLVATGIQYQVTLYYPLPTDISPDYVAVGDDKIQSDDPLYGVLEEPGVRLVAASWGPDFISEVGAPVTLASIVADIHDRCGLESSQFDVSELTDMVGGLVLAGDYTGADAINTLRGPYFFDKAEFDLKLWYPKRGAAVIQTLTVDDLIDEPDQQMREQAVEYPRKFHLFYQHAASGYAVVKATSQFSSPDLQVVGEVTTQVPIVFAGAEDEGQQTVDKMHKVSWAEAEGEVKFSIPWSFLKFVPSNPVALSLRGRVNRLRLTQLDLHDGVIDVTARHDRQSAYTSNVTGIPIPVPTPPPATIVGSTTLLVLDIPSLRDTEDDLNIYYAVTGAQPAWYGAVVQRSLDGGSTWSTITTINNAAVIGELLAAVPDASADYTDTTNSVHVRLYREGQTLDSISNAAFLSEGGAFALENAEGSWEICQARDWVHVIDNDYTGTTLHRGRLNSTTNSHAIGRRFVMLDGLTHVATQSSMIGQSVVHRAPSLSKSPELAATQTATYVGRSQIEWEPASLVLARSGSNIVSGSFAPRYRFGTDDAPVNSANMTGFRITIVGTSTVVLPDQVANTFSYDASALGASVTVSVQALNRITGAGPATSGTI